MHNKQSFLAQTRSKEVTNKTFIQAMLDPNADFGGLYTFDNIAPFKDIKKLYSLNYADMCKEIFSQLDINLDKDMLDYALQSYNNFRSQDIAPLVNIESNLYVLELYHGPTYAFKDMALQPFSRLLDSIAKKQNKKYLILSATSGDTGPATLSGFANSSNIKAICIYPKGGTSDIQRLQMTTQDAKNLNVFGIDGDFDLAQSTLKALLKDKDFRDSVNSSGYALSVANSVNIARIAFQIAYYFIIAKELYKQNIYNFDVIVPSGNFGNALGAFFAKQLGLPITKICIASNPNDILTQFFTTGIYDIKSKKLKLSYSPAMDILKSSNIERLLFAYFGADRTRDLMQSLDTNNYFSITNNELLEIQKIFEAKSFSDNECIGGIRDSFNNGYVIDPHTSNAYLFAKYRKQCDITQTQVIISTAHFAKFARAVCKATCDLDSKTLESLNDKELLSNIISSIKNKHSKELSIDSSILELFTKQEIHTKRYDANTLKEHILSWIRL